MHAHISPYQLAASLSGARGALLGLDREAPATDPAPSLLDLSAWNPKQDNQQPGCQGLRDSPRQIRMGGVTLPQTTCLSAGSRVPRLGLGPQPLQGPQGHHVQLRV